MNRLLETIRRKLVIHRDVIEFWAVSIVLFDLILFMWWLQ